MIIPLNELTPDTLRAIAEAFVLREGTDYGAVEASFEDKVDEVMARLNSGEAVLVYSELHETVDIKPPEAVTGETEDDAP